MNDGRGLVALLLIALTGAVAAREAIANRGSRGMARRSLAGLRSDSIITVAASPYEELEPLPWSLRAPDFLGWVNETLLDDKYGGFDPREPISENLDTAIEIAEANGYTIIVGAAP